ncbi:MAG: Sec-independent protein translocase protein TatB [Hyphomicrobiales bacterium]
MFDIGATEIIVIAVVAILVVGPKDLPRMLRTVGQYVSKLRGMAREFQHQFEEAARDTGLDDVKQGLSSVKEFSPGNQIKEAFNSITDEVEDVKAQVEQPVAPDTPETPDTSAEAAAEPAKAKKPAPKKTTRKKTATASKTTGTSKTAKKTPQSTASKEKAT